MKAVRQLTEAERFPLLTEAGRRLLNWMHEHPNAPRYNYSCGDQLTGEGLERVRAYEDELRSSKRLWSRGEVPDWASTFAERCLIDVPFYRRAAGDAQDFFSLPTCKRSDLEREQWAFVPDTQTLDELIIYYTSGTTGKAFNIPSHPEVSSKYLVKLRAALRKVGVELEGGKGRVSIVNPCAQGSTLTYATISSYLGEAGYVKVNLNPQEWKDAADPAKFIDDCEAEIFTGDPIAFIELARLPLTHKPKALVSSAMTLMPALKRELETRFGCPVIDVYSMNETRLIAAGGDALHEVVPHDLYIEILDREGNPCAPGERGEITVTCERNPFLPLLRYRTGDYAAISFDGERPALIGFEGRRPVVFLDTQGRAINNIDVTQALEPFAVGQFSLHQNADGSMVFKARGGDFDGDKIEAALGALFGKDQRLSIAELREEETNAGKVLQYTSDINFDEAAGSEMAYSGAPVSGNLP